MSAEIIQFGVNRTPPQVPRRVSARLPRPATAELKAAEEKKARQEKCEAERLEFYRDFGQRLRETRLALGITEVEAAAVCLTTLRTYRKREAGRPCRSWYEGLSSFATTYNLSYTWLYTGAGPMLSSEYEAIKQQYILEQKPKPKLTLVSNRLPS